MQDVLQELAGEAVTAAPAHSSREGHGHGGAAQHCPVPPRPHPAAAIQARQHRERGARNTHSPQRPPRFKCRRRRAASRERRTGRAARWAWWEAGSLCSPAPLPPARSRPGAARLRLSRDLGPLPAGLSGEGRRKRLCCLPPRSRQPWRLRCRAEEPPSRCRGEVESVQGVPCLETLCLPPHWEPPPAHGEWRAGWREEPLRDCFTGTAATCAERHGGVGCTRTMIQSRSPQGMRRGKGRRSDLETGTGNSGAHS